MYTKKNNYFLLYKLIQDLPYTEFRNNLEILHPRTCTIRNLTILDMLGQTLTLWTGLFFYLDILYIRGIFLLAGMVKLLYAGKQNRIVNGDKNSVEGGVTVIFMSKSPDNEGRSSIKNHLIL